MSWIVHIILFLSLCAENLVLGTIQQADMLLSYTMWTTVCISGGSGHNYDFCRQKNLCRDKHKTFVATNTNLCRDKDYITVRPPAHYSRSEHSGNSNSHGSNDGLKLSFLVFKALKTKVDNFYMVDAFVLANKENVNIDGCLWYFGEIS